MNRRTAFVGLAAGLTLLSGLGCSGRVISGKVMRGEIGRVIILNQTDPRFEDPGVEGITIKMSTSGGTGGRVALAETVTDEKGDFELKVSGSTKLPTRVTIRAEGPDEYEVGNSVFVPREGERALVLLRPQRTR